MPGCCWALTLRNAECRMQNADTEDCATHARPLLHSEFCILHYSVTFFFPSTCPSSVGGHQRTPRSMRRRRRPSVRPRSARVTAVRAPPRGASPRRSGCGRRRLPVHPAVAVQLGAFTLAEVDDVVGRELLQPRARGSRGSCCVASGILCRRRRGLLGHKHSNIRPSPVGHHSRDDEPDRELDNHPDVGVGVLVRALRSC